MRRQSPLTSDFRAWNALVKRCYPYHDVGDVLVNIPVGLTWNPSTFTAGPEVAIFKVPRRPMICGYCCVSVIAVCWPCGKVKEGCSSMAPLLSKNVRNTEISCEVDGFTSAIPDV
jgi:hypothetical protein